MIDRDLLWKAWPHGCLSHVARGHSTVGGYLNWGSGYWVTSPGVQGSEGHAKAPLWGVVDPFNCEPLENGHLLPNVDPADRATWAWLLAEFAQAVGEIADHYDPSALAIGANEHIVGYSLRFGDSGDHGVRTWQLSAYTEGRELLLFTYTCDTDDPALALVEGRIQVRAILDVH